MDLALSVGAVVVTAGAVIVLAVLPNRATTHTSSKSS
jgi:hypothetical protein